MSNKNYTIANATASRIIKDLHITAPEQIDIEAIAGDKNAFVKYDSIKGSSARLVKHGSVGIISINKKIREQGQKRFAIAHELGHFILHKSHNQIAECTDEMFLNWYKSRPEEPESNAFASEILMPSQIFKNYCRSPIPSFDEIRNLATDFNTSLTATAIKYIDNTPHPCVLVVSENKKVKWIHWRQDFPYRIIPKGSIICEDSCANDFFNKGQVPLNPEPLSGDVWLEDWYDGRQIILYEHAIALSYYNVVLSLIWAEKYD